MFQKHINLIYTYSSMYNIYKKTKQLNESSNLRITHTQLPKINDYLKYNSLKIQRLYGLIENFTCNNRTYPVINCPYTSYDNRFSSDTHSHTKITRAHYNFLIVSTLHINLAIFELCSVYDHDMKETKFLFYFLNKN